MANFISIAVRKLHFSEFKCDRLRLSHWIPRIAFNEIAHIRFCCHNEMFCSSVQKKNQAQNKDSGIYLDIYIFFTSRFHWCGIICCALTAGLIHNVCQIHTHVHIWILILESNLTHTDKAWYPVIFMLAQLQQFTHTHTHSMFTQCLYQLTYAAILSQKQRGVLFSGMISSGL